MVLLLLTCAFAPAAYAHARLPTLGSARYPGAGFPSPFPGFGTVAPKLVSANGDPNSTVRGISWSGWGKGEAKGLGVSNELAPRGGYLPGLFPVQLRASDLGRCRPSGPLVYRHLWRRDRIEDGRVWSSWTLWPDVSYPRPQVLC
jgi:hypothetical protein